MLNVIIFLFFTLKLNFSREHVSGNFLFCQHSWMLHKWCSTNAFIVLYCIACVFTCLTFCSVDKLCVSETSTYPQTTNSCGWHADVSEDGYLQSDTSIHTNSCCRTNSACMSDSLRCCHCDRSSLHTDWRPLLLVIPMRLGLTDINPIYFDAVKVCMIFWY